MVIEDLSLNYKLFSQSERQKLPSIQDRVFAFIFDFLLLTPIISLLGSPFIAKLKFELMIGHRIEYFQYYSFLLLVLSLVVISTYQFVAIYFFQNTFGQKQLQIYVCANSGKGDSQIEIRQALQYSFGYLFSFICFGLPFLSILTHPQQLTFYERMAELRTLSYKKSANQQISEFEVRFLNQWVQLVTLFLVIIAVASIGTILQNRMRSAQLKYSQVNSVCDNVEWNQENHQQRLENYFALWLAENKNTECVNHLLESQLWENINQQNQSFMYLVKFFMTEDEQTKNEYQKIVCSLESKNECQIIKYYLSDSLVKNQLATTQNWLQVLLIEELIRKKSFTQAFQVVQRFYGQSQFTQFYSDKLAQLYWQTQQHHSQRSPASLEESPIEKQFKIHFGVE